MSLRLAWTPLLECTLDSGSVITFVELYFLSRVLTRVKCTTDGEGGCCVGQNFDSDMRVHWLLTSTRGRLGIISETLAVSNDPGV